MFEDTGSWLEGSAGFECKGGRERGVCSMRWPADCDCGIEVPFPWISEAAGAAEGVELRSEWKKVRTLPIRL